MQHSAEYENNELKKIILKTNDMIHQDIKGGGICVAQRVRISALRCCILWLKSGVSRRKYPPSPGSLTIVFRAMTAALGIRAICGIGSERLEILGARWSKRIMISAIR